MEQIQKKSEVIRQEISEISVTNHLLKEQTELLAVDKERAQLDCIKELCKKRNNLYEKQNALKGQKWKIERSLKR